MALDRFSSLSMTLLCTADPSLAGRDAHLELNLTQYLASLPFLGNFPKQLHLFSSVLVLQKPVLLWSGQAGFGIYSAHTFHVASIDSVKELHQTLSKKRLSLQWFIQHLSNFFFSVLGNSAIS